VLANADDKVRVAYLLTHHPEGVLLGPPSLDFQPPDLTIYLDESQLLKDPTHPSAMKSTKGDTEMKASKLMNRALNRLAPLALATFLILCLCLVPSKTGMAQDDIEPDGVCRTQSELPVYPDIISDFGSSPNMDSSSNVVFVLNSNHAIRNDSCDLDKFKVIYRGNICSSQQVATGFFVVAQCDCHQYSLFGVKVKFSQNYNINGGILDSRKTQAYISIPPNPYCF
jgi:hypothetical protein